MLNDHEMDNLKYVCSVRSDLLDRHIRDAILNFFKPVWKSLISDKNNPGVTIFKSIWLIFKDLCNDHYNPSTRIMA